MIRVNLLDQISGVWYRMTKARDLRLNPFAAHNNMSHHVLKSLMKSFQCTLRLWVIHAGHILLDSELMHCCWNTPAMKLEPWSGRPISVKKLIRCLTIIVALIFLRGIASGNLVDTHIIVNNYWCRYLGLWHRIHTVDDYLAQRFWQCLHWA